jgi:hypothetical protein
MTTSHLEVSGRATRSLPHIDAFSPYRPAFTCQTIELVGTKAGSAERWPHGTLDSTPASITLSGDDGRRDSCCAQIDVNAIARARASCLDELSARSTALKLHA